MLLGIRTLSRGGYRIFSTTKTVLFKTKVNRWNAFPVSTNISTLDVSGVLNPALTETCTFVMGMVSKKP